MRIPNTFDDVLRIYDPRNAKYRSISTFLEKVGLNESDIKPLLPKKISRKHNLSISDFSKIVDIIKSNEHLLNSVQKYWNDKRHHILAYFEQTIEFEKLSFGFVDVNGSGVTMDIVQNLLTPIYSRPLSVFYLAINGKFENVYSSNIQKKIPWKGELKSSQLLEAFCRAPHSKCVGYSYGGDKITPVFETDSFKHPILDNYLALLSTLSNDFAKYGIYNESPNEGFFIFNTCIDYLSERPSKREVTAIGEVPFEYDAKLNKNQTFAPKYSIFGFVQELFGYFRYGYFVLSSYPEYSLWRGGWIQRRMGYLLSKCRKYHQQQKWK